MQGILVQRAIFFRSSWSNCHGIRHGSNSWFGVLYMLSGGVVIPQRNTTVDLGHRPYIVDLPLFFHLFFLPFFAPWQPYYIDYYNKHDCPDNKIDSSHWPVHKRRSFERNYPVEVGKRRSPLKDINRPFREERIKKTWKPGKYGSSQDCNDNSNNPQLKTNFCHIMDFKINPIFRDIPDFQIL